MTKEQDKLPFDELLRLAFIHAESDAQGLADAWPSDTPESKLYSERAEQFRRYRTKRWGHTSLEVALKDAKVIDVRTGLEVKRDV